MCVCERECVFSSQNPLIDYKFVTNMAFQGLRLISFGSKTTSITWWSCMSRAATVVCSSIQDGSQSLCNYRRTSQRRCRTKYWCFSFFKRVIVYSDCFLVPGKGWMAWFSPLFLFWLSEPHHHPIKVSKTPLSQSFIFADLSLLSFLLIMPCFHHQRWQDRGTRSTCGPN